MGKKFITLLTHSKTYRLYTQDIQNVHQKTIRKLPCLPKYTLCHKADDP
jgi:hypothetical protein